MTEYLPLIFAATLKTLELAVCSLLFGLFLSLIFVILETTRWKIVNNSMTFINTLLRGLPEILVVFLIYFGLPEIIAQFTGCFVDWSAFTYGVIALGIIFASYASQTLRGAIKAIAIGQWESGAALGLKRSYTFLHIILPQVWHHALPGLTNQWLVLLKDTALVSLISVVDLSRQAQLITTATHQPFTWYSIIGIIYLVITLLSQWVIRKLEYYFTRFEKYPV